MIEWNEQLEPTFVDKKIESIQTFYYENGQHVIMSGVLSDVDNIPLIIQKAYDTDHGTVIYVATEVFKLEELLFLMQGTVTFSNFLGDFGADNFIIETSVPYEKFNIWKVKNDEIPHHIIDNLQGVDKDYDVARNIKR